MANRRGVIGLPPSRERPRSAKREAGFTLIEVVVAFVVLSLVLAVVFEIFSTGLARASELDERSRALVVAQSKLALAGLEEALKDGESQGESEDRRFHWTVAVKRVQEDRESMPTLISFSATCRLTCATVQWFARAQSLACRQGRAWCRPTSRR